MRKTFHKNDKSKYRQSAGNMAATPISYQWLYGQKATVSELNEIISSFARRPTFFLLANINSLISFYVDSPDPGALTKADYVQRFLIHNLMDDKARALILREMDNQPPLKEGPVFHRQQLLMLMKMLLVKAKDDGPIDPNKDLAAHLKLGRLCLIMNDHLLTPEQEEQLIRGGEEQEWQKIHDELFAQFIYTAELRDIPDVYSSTVRNIEYLRIFERERTKFIFLGGLSLSERFAELKGLDLERYLWMMFGIYQVYDSLAEDPNTFINNPANHNIGRDTVFAKMILSPREIEAFFDLTARTFGELTEQIQQEAATQSEIQFRQDFTTFRDRPLIYTREEKDVAACIHFGLLSEKVSLSLYHIVLKALEGQPDRTPFLRRYWGDVFEIYVNDRLRDFIPFKTGRFFYSPMFDLPKKSSQAFDAVLIVGDALIAIEHKGKYLTLDAKYKGDRELLKSQFNQRYGLAARQLAGNLERVFNTDPSKRATFSERDSNGEVLNQFGPDRLRRIRRIYPLVVVQDFSLQLGFASWNLRDTFSEEIRQRNIDQRLVKPLTIITIEDLEAVLPYLKEVPLPNILDCYARELEPLKTFEHIFRGYLRRRGVKPRVNKWIKRRLGEMIDSMKGMFHTLDGETW